MSRVITLLGAALLLARLAPAQLAAGNWRTDLSRRSVPLAELLKGGPPKDGIPAIDRPFFDDVAQARSWIDPKEPVLVVQHGGLARAYPLQILIWHELVNDQIAGLPILVSYCPLCNSTIVFDRRVGGKTYDFGVSGMLRHSDMIMYDRATDSLWQQITGEAIVGSMTGERLPMLPSQTVDFNEFAKAFPEGEVLSQNTGYSRPYGQSPYAGYEKGDRPIVPVKLPKNLRLRPLERVVTIQDGQKAKAYPLSTLRRERLMEGRINQRDFVIFYRRGTVSSVDSKRIADSGDVGSATVFSPYLNQKRLRFTMEGDLITDTETGSHWNLFGIATDGPLTGNHLTPIDHGTYFAFAWLIFRPDTEIVSHPDGQMK
jgi:hypothetical protein